MIKPIINQFRRIWNDDGRNDKMFSYQEFKLKEALKDLQDSTQKVISASLNLQAVLTSKEPPKLH